MEFDVHRKTGDIAAEALGTDAGGIDLLQDFRFKLRVARIGIRGAEGTQQRMLGEIGGLFKSAADTDADHHRRTGIRTSVTDSL